MHRMIFALSALAFPRADGVDDFVTDDTAPGDDLGSGRAFDGRGDDVTAYTIGDRVAGAAAPRGNGLAFSSKEITDGRFDGDYLLMIHKLQHKPSTNPRNPGADYAIVEAEVACVIVGGPLAHKPGSQVSHVYNLNAGFGRAVEDVRGLIGACAGVAPTDNAYDWKTFTDNAFAGDGTRLATCIVRAVVATRNPGTAKSFTGITWHAVSEAEETQAMNAIKALRPNVVFK